MKFDINDIESLLEPYAGGFRQYTLCPPFCQNYVSEYLCELTGYEKGELLRADTDAYGMMIHPDDSAAYLQARSRLAEGECRLTSEYRILRKNGSIMYVSDAMSSRRQSDGELIGYSVVTDITAVVSENQSLRFLNDTVPCAMLRYTCDKHPKITYLNDRMKKIIRLPRASEGELDYMEMYKENIFLMVSMDERKRFAEVLSRVRQTGETAAGELSVIRCDGTRARLYGWVTKVVTDSGSEEFQSVCMDITEPYNSKKTNDNERYLKALSDVYDIIFEYDFANMTVKYLHGSTADTFGRVRNVPMHMEEAVEQWIRQTVCDKDRERVRLFFRELLDKHLSFMSRVPQQIEFGAQTADGREKPYAGIFLKTDADVCLFCLRSVTDTAVTDSLRDENASLKSMAMNMREVVMRFTEGIAAFEVKGDMVTPLYVSDNVCEFFGVSKEEWLPKMKKTTPIREFVAQSGVGYEKFSELLAVGEADFSYLDFTTNSQRCIKAICSEPHADSMSPRYVMLYNMDAVSKEQSASRISIRTFGYFDVFVDGKPIAFRNKKAKELLALLVDRRGGYITSEEAISFLWEDEPVSAVTLARYRKEALRLKNTLEEYGISDIMESVDGKRRIVTEKVECDLYDYLTGREEYAQSFKGSYLSNYSWGETTLGELINKNLQ